MLVTVLLVALAVAGCGLASTPGTIKIGLVAPFEGSYRSIGYDAIYAARLAVREINAAGGIGGWRVELVAYDDRGEVDLARRTARNLAIDHDVVAVIGHYRPDTSVAASAIYAEGGLPLLVLGGWAGSIPLTWSLAPSPDLLADAMVSLAERRSARSAAVSGQGAVAEALLARGVPEATLAPSQAGYDLAYVLWPSTQSAEYLVEWRASGWEGSVVGEAELAAAAFGQIAGGASYDVLFVTPYPFTEAIQGIEGWIADYRSVGPHVSDPGPYALPTYEAVYLVADAIATVRGTGHVPTRATVGDAIGAAHRNGWLGDISWNSQGYWQAPVLYVYEWLSGAPVLVGQVE